MFSLRALLSVLACVAGHVHSVAYTPGLYGIVQNNSRDSPIELVEIDPVTGVSKQVVTVDLNLQTVQGSGCFDPVYNIYLNTMQTSDGPNSIVQLFLFSFSPVYPVLFPLTLPLNGFGLPYPTQCVVDPVRGDIFLLAQRPVNGLNEVLLKITNKPLSDGTFNLSVTTLGNYSGLDTSPPGLGTLKLFRNSHNELLFTTVFSEFQGQKYILVDSTNGQLIGSELQSATVGAAVGAYYPALDRVVGLTLALQLVYLSPVTLKVTKAFPALSTNYKLTQSSVSALDVANSVFYVLLFDARDAGYIVAIDVVQGTVRSQQLLCLRPDQCPLDLQFFAGIQKEPLV